MSGQLQKEFWTYTLAGENLDIDSTFGLTTLSICLQSGSGFIQGKMAINDLQSKKIDLIIGQPITISTNSIAVISNLSIYTNGVVNLLGR